MDGEPGRLLCGAIGTGPEHGRDTDAAEPLGLRR